jgi:hypothetical protein
MDVRFFLNGLNSVILYNAIMGDRFSNAGVPRMNRIECSLGRTATLMDENAHTCCNGTATMAQWRAGLLLTKPRIMRRTSEDGTSVSCLIPLYMCTMCTKLEQACADIYRQQLEKTIPVCDP